MLYGLTAAVGWGVSAVTATVATRRAGTFIAVLVGQGLGMVVLVVIVLAQGTSFEGVDAAGFWGMAGAGLVGLAGYLSFYRALELGPIGMVSSIGATYGGVTAILALVLLSERLGVSGTTGVALSVLGVTLAAARHQPAEEPIALSSGEPIVGIAPSPRDIATGRRTGIPLALVSALSYGVGGFLLGYFSGRFGAIETALVARLGSMIALLAILPFLGKPSAWRGTGSGVTWAVAAGVTDVIGVIAFAKGGEAGQVAITAAVSSVYPVIPLVAGIAMFGERLGRRQVAGVVLILIGLILIGT